MVALACFTVRLKNGPTTLEFVFSKGRLKVSRDEETLGSADIEASFLKIEDVDVSWDKRVFGRSPGSFTGTSAVEGLLGKNRLVKLQRILGIQSATFESTQS